jgi:hypothetical protein
MIVYKITNTVNGKGYVGITKHPAARKLISDAMVAHRAKPEIRQRYSKLMTARNALGNNQSKKTHCPQGHPYDLLNTRYKRNGWRRCRECDRLSCKRRRERRPFKDIPPIADKPGLLL